MMKPGTQVFDTDGLQGVVEHVTPPEEDGSRRVVVLFAGDQRVRLPAEIVTPHTDGAYRIPFRLGALQPGQAGSPGEGQTWVFPVMREELSVERRTVDVARVRVTKSVREEERVVDESLWRDEVGVELVEVNRVVDGPVAVRQEGDTTIVPLLEEVLVVEKRLLLREELRLTRRRVQVHARQNVTLRAEEISVDRVPLARGAQGEPAQSGQSPEKVSES